jgi:hypothetical protein
VAVQAVHGLVLYGNPVLTGIGLIAYLGPVPAFMVGYRYACSGGQKRLLQLLRWYAVMSLIFVSGVYLEYLKVKWPILGEIAGGFKIYDLGTVLRPYSGFMRTSEIAAWHAASAVCILVILGIHTQSLNAKIPPVLGIVVLVFAGVLTARRKMLVEIVVFFAAYWFLLAFFRMGSRKVAAMAVVVGMAGFLVINATGSQDLKGEKFQLYIERGTSVFGDIPERTHMSVIQTVKWAYTRFGLLGAGAGAGSQGTQHYGGGTRLVGGAPEGGMGKILTELGAPGILVSLWLLVAIGRHVVHVLRQFSGRDTRLANLIFGLVALLIANAVTFLVATQAYGDPFVLIILGWVLGFVLATPVLQARELEARELEARPVLHLESK